ncbi:5-formyltetrahydrofolate cyclo-ligase [Ensifer adhaerens]|uniref:5-formyltetrahydrofolate cyclo-ligase n=1 Tax=Ensifer adhaerens TaxID=106592 RepID=UPI001CBC436C|nr:5-formyltetrahydrofolate cyclo-ligase [Ensifer adhaerens]MBZ7925641.1 5-formyltetrahydrofolate cyclo-ligase [Ensifer adhaerens]UAX95215.1 5-formyltetrahydrofolate cyclo-ligase [Ensifer adhaerens]UAY02894.1 5-formyltetrahydrofolate cyclo-ligase [Ensifer adhaerens]UAY10878.1 5-formyltetrahydrofolate cyclo-ligase [Ensifer adhaerens]
MCTPDEDDIPPGFSSPPCLMHEVDPVYMGIEFPKALPVAQWRELERKRLIPARQGIPSAERSASTDAIVTALDQLLPNVRGETISLYWPFRGEPDLRACMSTLIARGADCALPVVVAKAKPLGFRSWRAGEALEKGVWGIPIPSNGRDVQPTIVIAPLVGFDESGFRLGYGGGYYDRTLAVLQSKPFVIGVGFEQQKMESIRPQWHDIAMDAIVTEGRTLSCGPGQGLNGASSANCR